MSERADLQPPDWYYESLVARYQYLTDELHALKNKYIINASSGFGMLVAAGLSYMAFGDLWASSLVVFLMCIGFENNNRTKIFIVANQMLMIEAEFPNVVENVAPPRG